jgi:gamma-glutamylcyclotransferase (GGCT)/AIG2-like uncharacterized protein YtfP
VEQHLFIYGTLLPALAPAHLRDLVGQLRARGRGHVRGRLHDLGPYPAGVLDPSAATQVAGMVFRLPDEPAVLSQLDEYEGFDPQDPAGSLFLRVPVAVTLADGSELRCWMYVYNHDPGDAPLVPDGDYVRWKEGGGTVGCG